jgi:hypothetical protein
MVHQLKEERGDEMNVEEEKPPQGFFAKKNDCPKCGATADEYIAWAVNEAGDTISCNMCPKGSVDV